MSRHRREPKPLSYAEKVFGVATIGAFLWVDMVVFMLWVVNG